MRIRKKKLWIIGAGNHAKSVAQLLIEKGTYQILGFYDSISGEEKCMGLPIIRKIENMELNHKKGVVIAVGNNYDRMKLVEKVLHIFPNHSNFPIVIHPSAVISKDSILNAGSIILANTIVGRKARTGEFSLINNGAQLDHDSNLGPFSSLAPGSIVAGNVNIGKLSAVGIGSVVMNGLTLGNNCQLGSYSFLNENMEDDILSVGIPAKKIRFRRMEEPTT